MKYVYVVEDCENSPGRIVGVFSSLRLARKCVGMYPYFAGLFRVTLDDPFKEFRK